MSHLSDREDMMSDLQAFLCVAVSTLTLLGTTPALAEGNLTGRWSTIWGLVQLAQDADGFYRGRLLESNATCNLILGTEVMRGHFDDNGIFLGDVLSCYDPRCPAPSRATLLMALASNNDNQLTGAVSPYSADCDLIFQGRPFTFTRQSLELVELPSEENIEIAQFARELEPLLNDPKNYDAARQRVDILLRKYPGRADILHASARIYLMQGSGGNAVKAQADLALALEVAPEPSMRYDMARALTRLKKYPDAIRELRSAAEAGQASRAKIEREPDFKALRSNASAEFAKLLRLLDDG